MTKRLNNTYRSYFFWSDVFLLILKCSFHQFQMYLSDRYDHQQVHIGHWPACHVSSYLRVYCYPVISHCPTHPILQYIVYVLTDLICPPMELINFFETHFWELQEVNWKYKSYSVTKCVLHSTVWCKSFRIYILLSRWDVNMLCFGSFTVSVMFMPFPATYDITSSLCLLWLYFLAFTSCEQ